MLTNFGLKILAAEEILKIGVPESFSGMFCTGTKLSPEVQSVR